jgi:hypothetical protein
MDAVIVRPSLFAPLHRDAGGVPRNSAAALEKIIEGLT